MCGIFAIFNNDEDVSLIQEQFMLGKKNVALKFLLLKK